MLLLGPSHGWAATWGPQLRLETRYDDNVFQDSTGTEDVVTAVTPGILLRREDSIFPWELSARRTFASYHRSEYPDTRTDRVVVQFDYMPSENSSIGGDYRFVRSRDPIDFDQRAILTPGVTTTSTGSANANTWRGEGSFRFNERQYRSPELADGISRSWLLNLFPIRTATTAWIVGYRGRDLDSGGRTALTSHVVTAGVRRFHTKHLSSELQIGAVETDFADSSARERRAAVSAEIKGVRAHIGYPVVARFRVAHDVTTTLAGEVSQNLRNGRIFASWERLLDVEGAVFRNPTVTQRGTWGVQDTVWGAKVIALEGSVARTRPLRAAGRKVDVYRASVSFSTPIGPWLTGRTGYDFLRQDAPEGSDARDFRRNRFVVSLTTGAR
jgi:hypothetical protein